MALHSYNTQLKDRVLWYDGASTYASSNISNTIRNRTVLYVDTITNDIISYNKLCDKNEKITVKQQCDALSLDWNIPDEYKTLDIECYIYDKLYDQCSLMSDDEIKNREVRIASELILFKQYGAYDLLRAIIYVINTLTLHNAVWGVGRGSSVSSYVLYLIGVHDVDSYRYDLDVTDFLHD